MTPVYYSTLAGVPQFGGASSATYAYNLARKALLQKNLNSLDSAVTRGDLGSARNAYKTLVTNNPQYRSGPASDLESPLNAGFRDLAKALDDGKMTDAQAAWKKLTTEFEKQALAINSGNETAAQARAALVSYSSESVLSSWQQYGQSGQSLDGGYSAGSFLSAFA